MLTATRALGETVSHYVGTRTHSIQWAKASPGHRDFQWIYRVDRRDRITTGAQGTFVDHTSIRFTSLESANAGIREDSEERTTRVRYGGPASDRALYVLGVTYQINGVEIEPAPGPSHLPYTYAGEHVIAYLKPRCVARMHATPGRSWENDVAANVTLTESSRNADGWFSGMHNGTTRWNIASDGSFSETLQPDYPFVGAHSVGADGSAAVREESPGFSLLDQQIGSPRMVDGKTVVPVTTIRRGRNVPAQNPTPAPSPEVTLAALWYPNPTKQKRLRGDRVAQHPNVTLPSFCRDKRWIRADDNDELNWIVDPADGTYRIEHSHLYLRGNIAVCISQTVTRRTFEITTGALLATEEDATAIRLL